MLNREIPYRPRLEGNFRIRFYPIYERIRNFNKADLLVGNQIQEKDEWKFKPLKEVEPMPEPTESSIKDLDFVRDFYRGMSAYADHVEDGLLAKIHLETRLDDAIANAVKTGKDIVLTGNAGDGKTHITFFKGLLSRGIMQLSVNCRALLPI